MKLFDNLVIYFRQSIPPGEPQLKETPSDKGTRKHFQADERLRPNTHPSTHTQKTHNYMSTKTFAWKLISRRLFMDFAE